MIRHEHTRVNRTMYNGVVDCGFVLIQEGGMAACPEDPRLFPGQLPDLDRYWVEAAIYINDCLNTTATTVNLHYKFPYETFSGDCRRPTPAPSCSQDSAAYTAPKSSSPRPSGAFTSIGGGTTRETA